jgi:predicted aspartyl protease
MKYKFERDTEGKIILVPVQLGGKHTFKMVVDTGASHTVIDSSALYIAGYKITNIVEVSKIETANGIVEVEVFELDSLTALGHTKHNFPVYMYDFLAHGILSDYDGLLGLDFFENSMFCIDMKTNTITMR